MGEDRIALAHRLAERSYLIPDADYQRDVNEAARLLTQSALDEAAPSAVAPDDAVREVTPAGRERDVHRDLRAENERLRERVSIQQDAIRGLGEVCEEHLAARDAALAGERAAREALARVEALIDPEAGMAITPYGNGVRFFEERNIRAALSPTPPEDLGQPPHGHGENVCPGNVPHEECCGPCHVARRAALSPTDQDQSAPVLAPPDTAEQEPAL